MRLTGIRHSDFWLRSLLPAIPAGKSETAQVVAVLAASGIGGFHAGMVTFPDWQVAVETSQVIAGIVQYPAGNPFYLYHLKLWTILHQICALLLWSGVSEIALSKILSGVLGMVSFQGIALIVYALSRDTLLAVASAFFIAFTRTAEFGVNYPIYLMGTHHTYGAIGLSLLALIAGLAGTGWYRAAGFLLGVGPAVHPSLGAWFTVTVAAAALWHARHDRADLQPALKFVVLGCAVTAISLLVHLAQSRGTPEIDPQLASRYLTNFVSLWDTHRQTVSLLADGTKLTMGTLALAVLWLKLEPGLPGSSKFLLRLVVVTATLSLVLVLLSSVPPGALPSTLLILMPGRFVNFNALVAVAVLIGLLGHAWRSSGRFWSAFPALYLAVGLLIGNRSMLWEWLQRDDGSMLQSVLRNVMPGVRTKPLQILLTVTVLLIVVAVLSRWRAAGRTSLEHPVPPVAMGPARLATALVRGGLVMILLGVTVLLWSWPPRNADAVFLDRTTNRAFAHMAAGRGLLVTGGEIQLVQLRTRRPVLIDSGALDGLPYALEGGPALERILRDVYAIDLFNPPDEARGRGAIPNEYNKAVWERFSREHWQRIRCLYDVTQVMTPPGWTLALPVAALDGGFIVYDIPDERCPEHPAGTAHRALPPDRHL